MKNQNREEVRDVVEGMAKKWLTARKKYIDWSVHDERPQCDRPMSRRLLKQEREQDYLEEAEIKVKVCIEMIIVRLVAWQSMRRTRMGATDESLMVDPPKTDVTN
ncbi:MAG TPA: hypothetical protein VN375_13080 [Vicinamibacteria bacterium]|jgi:hypothetical protein|nr:hypothetical protein [Vicinamibacteria bacterium]